MVHNLQTPEALQLWWDNLTPQWQQLFLQQAGLYSKHRKKQTLTTDDLQSILTLKKMEISHSKITNLQPLAQLRSLQHVSIHHCIITEIYAVGYLPELVHFSCTDTPLDNISPLSACSQLEVVKIDKTLVNDLSPLKELVSLREISCAHTKVTNIAPLRNLPLLQVVDISFTRVDDLSSLRDLKYLRVLRFESTFVNNIEDLLQLPQLNIVHCEQNDIKNLSLLFQLSNIQQVFDGKQLFNHINIETTIPVTTFNTPSKDLKNPQLYEKRLRWWQALPECWKQIFCYHVLDMYYVENDLSEYDLAKICQLKKISVAIPFVLNYQHKSGIAPHLLITSLESLAALDRLEQIDISDCHVTDLSPLAKLPRLHKLICNNTPISNFQALAHCNTLRRIECKNTNVSRHAIHAFRQQQPNCRIVTDTLSELNPFAWLSDLAFKSDEENTAFEPSNNLDSADLRRIWWNDLHENWQKLFAERFFEQKDSENFVPTDENLVTLLQTKRLDCSHAAIINLKALRVFQHLEELDCSYTDIYSLEPLSETYFLRQLICNNTYVVSLFPLAFLPNLNLLNCSHTPITGLEPLAHKATITHLYCEQLDLDDIDAKIIATLSGLTHLSIAQTSITDLKFAKSLHHLNYLDCNRCAISSILPIINLRLLQHLNFADTLIPQEDLDLFQKQRPDCKIIRHSE